MTRNDADPSAPVSCPVCGKPAAAVARLRPFCSARCADVDLGRWLTGQYRVPGPPPEDEPEENPPVGSSGPPIVLIRSS
jgi:endogenous inhibitor of DNA gyrase (YacG/DUF329 family)